MSYAYPGRPEPVDDDLLADGEYMMAVDVANERTNEKIAERVASLTYDERMNCLNGLLFDDERPMLAGALLDLYQADGEDALHNAALVLKYAIEGALHEHQRDEVKPVDVEDVLREWHQPPDDAYNRRKAMMEG